MARIGTDAPVMQAGLDRTVLDGVLEELRFTSVKPKEATPEKPAQHAGGRPRVLVVEDNLDMNRFVAESLSQEYERRRDGRADAGAPGAAADADPLALGQGR